MQRSGCKTSSCSTACDGGQVSDARQTTAPSFLRNREVLNLVEVSRSSHYRWMEAETFPKQISVGGNTVVLVESAATAWIERGL